MNESASPEHYNMIIKRTYERSMHARRARETVGRNGNEQ